MDISRFQIALRISQCLCCSWCSGCSSSFTLTLSAATTGQLTRSLMRRGPWPELNPTRTHCRSGNSTLLKYYECLRSIGCMSYVRRGWHVNDKYFDVGWLASEIGIDSHLRYN